MNMSYGKGPDNNHIRFNFLQRLYVLPFIAIVLIILFIFIYKGKKFNESMTDMDIAQYTMSLGSENDCYFDNVTVLKEADGTTKGIVVKDSDYSVEASPFIDPNTKSIIGYKVSRPQIMYCTIGRFNYKSPIITLDRILSEQAPTTVEQKTSKFNKEWSYKRIDKLGNYLRK